jgi:hypothetical protein
MRESELREGVERGVEKEGRKGRTTQRSARIFT